MHAHSAAHILIAKYPFQLITKQDVYTCYGALVPSNIAHTVKTNGEAMLVFLFDETTSVSLEIRSVTLIEEEKVKTIVNAFQSVKEDSDNVEVYHAFIDQTLVLLNFHSYSSLIKDERIIEAIRYIKEHCDEDITCAEIASVVSLSESRFSHLFHEQAGITFAGFLILRRLEYAYELLSKHHSITDAAITAGFSDASHFAYINQKMFGITASNVSQQLIIHHMI